MLYEQTLENLNLERGRTVLSAERSLGQMNKELKDAELLLQYQNVVAPVSGVIFDPQVSQDGVIQAGETILSIVPQDALKALVFVPNKDIGFVKGGQKAKVRVDASHSRATESSKELLSRLVPMHCHQIQLLIHIDFQ